MNLSATRRPPPPAEPLIGGYGGGGGSGAGVFAGGGAGAFAFAGAFLNDNDAGGCLNGADMMVGGDLGASNHAAALDALGASLSRGYGQDDDCCGADAWGACEAGGTEGCLDRPGPERRDASAVLSRRYT